METRREWTWDEKFMAAIASIECLMDEKVEDFRAAGVVTINSCEERDEYISKLLWARDELHKAYKKRIADATIEEV